MIATIHAHLGDIIFYTTTFGGGLVLGWFIRPAPPTDWDW